MQQDINLRVDPRTASDMKRLSEKGIKTSGIKAERVKGTRIIKRSIDARQRKVTVNITLRLYIDENIPVDIYPTIDYAPVKSSHQAVVVGAGPAGLFAALRLIERGIKPIGIERGKDVDSRRKDMAAIARENIVDQDSNYCFGEGGAGAYSDGKLYTRSKKRGSVEKILSILHQHGADESIMVDAHPHIGTDKLPVVIKAIRNTIIRAGGEVYFNQRVCDITINNDTVTGVKTITGEE